jgi:hypothetical protein
MKTLPLLIIATLSNGLSLYSIEDTPFNPSGYTSSTKINTLPESALEKSSKLETPKKSTEKKKAQAPEESALTAEGHTSNTKKVAANTKSSTGAIAITKEPDTQKQANNVALPQVVCAPCPACICPICPSKKVCNYTEASSNNLFKDEDQDEDQITNSENQEFIDDSDESVKAENPLPSDESDQEEDNLSSTL